MTDGDVALFDAGQMNDGPLEAFGGMEGKEFDGLAVGIGLIGASGGGEPQEESVGSWWRFDSHVVASHLHECIEIGAAFGRTIAFGFVVDDNRKCEVVDGIGEWTRRAAEIAKCRFDLGLVE